MEPGHGSGTFAGELLHGVFLGSAETVGSSVDLFAVSDSKHKIFARKNGSRGWSNFQTGMQAQPIR